MNKEVDFQAVQQVFPPPSVHPGYFGGGSVFQSMAGHTPGNQFYTPGTVFGGAQTLLAGHTPRNQFYTPGAVFGGAQVMMPNPMYGSIGMQLDFQSTQGQFGMPQANFGMTGISNQQPYMASSASKY